MKPNVETGMRSLKKYLAGPGDLRRFDFDQYQNWLERQLTYQQNDAVFSQRCYIRDIKKKHRKKLRSLGQKEKSEYENWQSSPERPRLEQLQQKIMNSEKAIEGLEKAVAQRQGEAQLKCCEKLKQYQADLQEMKKEQKELLSHCPSKKKWDKALKKQQDFIDEIGISEAEKNLKKLFGEQGRRAGRAGSNFEQLVKIIVQDYIVANIIKQCRKEKIHILSNVTLGCARAELDHVVVRAHERRAVEVLAIIEVKRNINDISGGFETRQENLAWFTNDSTGYDPKMYRTKIFRRGHFDCPARHEQNGREYVFDQSSFRYFQRDKKSGHFLRRLHFITKYRKLTDMTSGEKGKFFFRISTDLDFDINDEQYVRDLQDWHMAALSPLQTRDVIEFYTRDSRWARQFFLVRQ